MVKILICTMPKIRLELVTYKKSWGLGEEAFGLPPVYWLLMNIV